VVRAQKIAFKALTKWMDEHISYQIAYSQTPQPEAKKRSKKEPQKDEDPRPVKKKRTQKQVAPKPRPQYTGCGPNCAGNVVAGTPCPSNSEATPGTGVRHAGKTHAVCDTCRKAVQAFRRKKKREEKKVGSAK